MKEVIRYKCDFCVKTLSSKSKMHKHELICFKNPNSKSCITCKHFNPDHPETFNPETGVETCYIDRFCHLQYNIKNSLRTNCQSHKLKS